MKKITTLKNTSTDTKIETFDINDIEIILHISKFTNTELRIEGIEILSEIDDVNDLLNRFGCKSVNEFNAIIIDKTLMQKYSNNNYLITHSPV